ncbi:hypothetical protein ACA106_09295 [Agrobacterium pusense]
MGLPDVFLGKYVGNYHPRNAACPDPILSAFRVEKTLKKKVLAKRHRKKIDKKKFYLFI